MATTPKYVTFTCAICAEKIKDEYGNNPDPIVHVGTCCRRCDNAIVIPTRIAIHLGAGVQVGNQTVKVGSVITPNGKALNVETLDVATQSEIVRGINAKGWLIVVSNGKCYKIDPITIGAVDGVKVVRK